MGRIKRSHTRQKRDVSFSKRKKALLNKAMEICILCKAQVGLIITSPTGKLTVFEHSSGDNIFYHFQNKTTALGNFITNEHIERRKELTRLNNQLEGIKKRAKDHKDYDLNLQQWIENRWNTAQTEEEVLEVVKEFELLKEKLVGRSHNMQPDNNLY